jgi:hypothetical protein
MASALSNPNDQRNKSPPGRHREELPVAAQGRLGALESSFMIFTHGREIHETSKCQTSTSSGRNPFHLDWLFDEQGGQDKQWNPGRHGT